MKYSTDPDIVLDNRPKIIIPKEVKLKNSAELEERYLLVYYRQKGDTVYFFTNSSDVQRLAPSSSLPANVIASINTPKKISALFNAVNIKLTDKTKADELLKKLYEIENSALRNEIVSVQKQNYEIRKLLENTKQTLMELSIFANSTALPLSKKEFAFPIERSAGFYSLESGEAYRQNIPVSSLYLSGIRLFFESAMYDGDLYALNDTLVVKLITKESHTVIGAWEVPFGRIEKSIVLELTAPYIKSKESVYLYMMHTAQTDLKIRLSKKVFDKRLRFASDKTLKGVSKSPIALEIYKNHHSFSLLSSPFIKSKDVIFREFDRSYISRRLIENSLMILGEGQAEESGEISFVDDLFAVTTRQRTQIEIGNSITPGVKSFGARAQVVQGFGEVGVALISDRYRGVLLDDEMLGTFEEEGYFSGWIETRADGIVVSISLVTAIEEPMHLVVLSKNHLTSSELRIEWSSFELYFDDLL